VKLGIITSQKHAHADIHTEHRGSAKSFPSSAPARHAAVDRWPVVDLRRGQRRPALQQRGIAGEFYVTTICSTLTDVVFFGCYYFGEKQRQKKYLKILNVTFLNRMTGGNDFAMQ